MLKLSADEVTAFVDEVFPQQRGRVTLLSLQPDALTLEFAVTEADLRPGDTVSGPTVFAAADISFYLLTLAMIGKEALTVTTNVSINFVRKPTFGPIRCEARMLKLGRSLAVGDVLVYPDGAEAPCAHASVTYSIPPKPRV